MSKSQLNPSNLKPAKGATKKRKRVGIGPSSGHGGTSCRGHKGQNSRSGGGGPAYFEGGQTPLIRRLPKRGFVNIFRVPNQVVNVADLSGFDAGTEIDRTLLIAAGLVQKSGGPIKVLGDGDLDRALTVKVDRVSESAKKKIEAAGGTIELTAKPTRKA
jgi:large subunit ribosomal protein L15